jgi:hypothetical protein
MIRPMIIHLAAWLQKYLARRGFWVQVSTIPDSNPGDAVYVGDLPDSVFLARRGIRPERAREGLTVATVGFCAREQKWYGWSHRAIHGFAVGDVVTEGSCCTDYLLVGFTAATLEDAREMACAFARSVS